MADRLPVAVLGASGYAGLELLRLCAGHPHLEVVAAGADTQAGHAVGELYPSVAAEYAELTFEHLEPESLDGVDVVFLALPHGESQHLVPRLPEGLRLVVDLAADFRLRDHATYRSWYGSDHGHPELLDNFAYGLPELFGEALPGAASIAAPGCYPTAAALALAPLVREELIDSEGVIVDAASGVSGAGRRLSHSSHFNTVDEDFTAYGLLSHRHTPEIEQATGAQVLFTPHLAPMNRGILATCYGRATSDRTTDDLLELLREFYSGQPFVVVSEASPSTKATLGSNVAHLTVRCDERTGFIVSICALDNLVKGAAGQAIQCANIVLDLPQEAGLPTIGVYP